MTEAIVGLISGVIGALVGGAASLVGSITVGRMQFARDARVRIFREIIPRITERTLPSFMADQESDQQFSDYEASIAELAREAQVAGKHEARAMRKIFLLNTGSGDTQKHGTFEIRRSAVVQNHSAIVDALVPDGIPRLSSHPLILGDQWIFGKPR